MLVVSVRTYLIINAPVQVITNENIKIRLTVRRKLFLIGEVSYDEM